MKFPILSIAAGLLPAALLAASCEAGSQGGPGGDGLAFRAGAPPSALAGVVATDSVTTETRRILAEAGGATHVSLDGRHLAVIDWQTGDVLLRDLVTGEERRLTDNVAPYDPGLALTAVISPEGDRVAFTWQEMAKGDRGEIRVATIRDEEVTVEAVYSRPGEWPEVAAWSPDGEHLLIQRSTPDGTYQVELLPLSGEPPRLLMSLGWSQPQAPAFSPDGSHVAFDFTPDAATHHRRIQVVSVDGTRGGAVVEGSGDERFLGWSPDGHILFFSDRRGRPGVWRIPVEEGRAAGEPELVAPDLRPAGPLGFDREGRFYYRYETAVRSVQAVTIDPEGGRILTPPAPAAAPGPGGREPAWSPDGRHLAYIRGPHYNWQDPDQAVVLRSLESGEIRVIHLPPRVYGLRFLHWSADGTALFVSAIYDGGSPSFVRIDIRTGESERTRIDGLRMSHGEWFGFARALPDGRSLVGARAVALDGENRVLGQIVQMELDPAEERVILETVTGVRNPLPEFALSPRGDTLAVAVRHPEGTTIRLHPVRGGTGRDLVELEHTLHRQTLVWTADGGSLLYVEGDGAVGQAVPGELTRNPSLMQVTLADGTVREVGSLPRGLSELQVHPDGRRLAFVAGEPESEIWVMERIGPLVQRTSSRDR
jgi:Tol biopolymer transport system component